MRPFGFVLVLLLVLAACTSSPSNGSAPGSTASPAPATGTGSSPFEPLPAGITVKDAFTAVLVQVADPPTFPFAGSDGKFHVAYNVVLQNASRVPAAIRRLEVVDATDPTKVLASFADKQWLIPPAALVTVIGCGALRAGAERGDPTAGGAGALRRLRLQRAASPATLRTSQPSLLRCCYPHQASLTPYVDARGCHAIDPRGCIQQFQSNARNRDPVGPSGRNPHGRTTPHSRDGRTVSAIRIMAAAPAYMQPAHEAGPKHRRPN
jgi:hypothetical protein